MKEKILAGVLLIFGYQLSAHAGSLQAVGTEQTIGVSLTQNIVGPLNLDASYMHNYVNSSELINAGLHLDMGLGPVTGQVGVKAFYTEMGDISGSGYAPGVGISIAPVPAVSLAGNYYYSNDKSAEDKDVQHYREWSATVNFHPVSQTNLFVGYGFKSVQVAGSDEVIMNDGPIVGVSLNY